MKPLLAGAALWLAPTLAQAHTLCGSGGMLSGFTHALLGWDHLLIMLWLHSNPGLKPGAKERPNTVSRSPNSPGLPVDPPNARP